MKHFSCLSTQTGVCCIAESFSNYVKVKNWEHKGDLKSIKLYIRFVNLSVKATKLRSYHLCSWTFISIDIVKGVGEVKYFSIVAICRER